MTSTAAAHKYELQEAQSYAISRQDGAGEANVRTANIDATTVVFNASAAVPAGRFAGGLLTLLDGSTLTPESYLIYDNAASSGSGTTRPCELTLEHPLRRAAGVDTTMQLVSSSFANCRQGTESEHDAVGVPMVAIPANFFFLGLVRGRVPLKFNADVTAGENAKRVVKSATGHVEIADHLGRQSVGQLVGNQTIANTNFSRWGVVEIDLL